MHHPGPGAWVSMIMLLDLENSLVDTPFLSAIRSLVHYLDLAAYLQDFSEPRNFQGLQGPCKGPPELSKA